MPNTQMLARVPISGWSTRTDPNVPKIEPTVLSA